MSDININMVKITDRDGNTIDVYANDISMYLQEYIDNRDIKDMCKEPQSRWNAALIYINKQLFAVNRDRLYTDTRLNNAYNLDLIDCVCDIYITLCYEYDKEVSISGFSKLTGIDTDTVNSWGREETRVGSKGSVIYKKLNIENEESLSNMLIGGKRNPVGILGALNRRHGWNMGQPRGADGSKAGITYSREEIVARAKEMESLPGSVDDLPD